MADDYIELFLKWSAGADQDFVRSWLDQRDLTNMKMKFGLLVSGTKAAIENALAVSLANVQPPAELPIPPELKAHVASITFPKPRSYHA
ncbi:MAG TPA: hypothetical protein VFM63_01340 [Pyrinomonadaceae bacterium]|nr:hypothetical protein [Pyrinomonadaceae bacterium]